MPSIAIKEFAFDPAWPAAPAPPAVITGGYDPLIPKLHYWMDIYATLTNQR